MPTITVNGVELYYELTGDVGEPLVFIHGSWIDHNTWNSATRRLSSDFRVLTYDRRGHGKSERVAGSGRIAEDLADARALIEQLDLAPAHVVGNSLGGSIALQLASEHPELFRSLAVHEPPLVGMLPAEPGAEALAIDLDQRFERVKERLRAGDLACGARLFLDLIIQIPGGWEQLTPTAQYLFTTHALTWLDETEDPAAWTLDLERMSGFEKPTLLTQGDQSPGFYDIILARVASVLPQARRQIFRQTGHSPQVTIADEFAATLRRFWGSGSGQIPTGTPES